MLNLKSAHSSNLTNGYIHQLPEYMKANGTDNGVYVAFWYKGKNINKPKYDSPVDLGIDLKGAQIKAKVRDNMHVIKFDFSSTQTPSQIH